MDGASQSLSLRQGNNEGANGPFLFARLISGIEPVYFLAEQVGVWQGNDGQEKVKLTPFPARFHLNRQYFLELDAADVLAPFRDEFLLPDGVIYLCGNSLGAMPRCATEIARRTMDYWAENLVKSWNTADWFHLPQRLGRLVAGLVGAAEDEVVVTDATGINLFKVLAAALSLRPDRNVILMEGSNFPTDNYTAQGLIALLGNRHRLRFAEHDGILAAMDDDVAVVALTEVHYKTGRVHDMKTITAGAHAHGALTVWDLCHSAGVMPVDLNGCDADFAVGCTYKYLNGGPGSPAFIFAARRHHGMALQPLTGWYSHASPFAFERDYRPAPGIEQMQSGTPPILSLAVAEAGISITARASMAAIREKSQRMGDLFIELADDLCDEFEFQLASPRTAEHRGSQVSLTHQHGYPIMRALISRGVIGDFRAPDILRFGFAPLYLRYLDIWNAAQALRDIMQTDAWRLPEFNTALAVT